MILKALLDDDENDNADEVFSMDSNEYDHSP